MGEELELFIRDVYPCPSPLNAATRTPPPSALDCHELLTYLQLPDIHIRRKLLRQRLAGVGTSGGRGDVCRGGRWARAGFEIDSESENHNRDEQQSEKRKV